LSFIFNHYRIILPVLLLSIILSTCREEQLVKQRAPGVAVEDGAWNWCGDPRAVYYSGRDEKTYVGYVTSDGSIGVSSYNHEAGMVAHAILHEKYDRDDHDNPIIFIRPDGRIMAFYQKHHDENMIRYRVTTNPEDITEWGPFQAIPMPSGVTYIHIFQLPKENNRIYMFTRCIDWKPTMLWSDDDGETWSKPVKIIDSGRFGRPYIKAVSDGQKTIHFTFTDGHPRVEPNNNIYYIRYENGGWFTIHGDKIADTDSLPVMLDQADLIYDGSTRGRGWTWDIALDKSGNPVMVYTVSPSEEDHRYYYSAWDGSAWQTSEITRGGRWFPQTPAGKREPEPHYAGGLTLDHENPGMVYTSRQVNGVFEIERWTTADYGATWTTMSITRDSTVDNVRPFVTWSASGPVPPGRKMLYWMHATHYIHYDSNYFTSIHYTITRP
jgi:hypothetical protein